MTGKLNTTCIVKVGDRLCGRPVTGTVVIDIGASILGGDRVVDSARLHEIGVCRFHLDAVGVGDVTSVVIKPLDGDRLSPLR